MTSALSHAEETSTRRPPTAAQLYTDAVWESKHLTPNERLICLSYADHAHEAGRPVDRAWVTTARLMERTGMSKGAVIQARNGAVGKGWLTDIGSRPGHKQIRVYRLRAPDESAALSSSTAGRGRDGKGRFAAKPVQEEDRFTTEPVHAVNRSGETTEPAPAVSIDVNVQVEGLNERTGPPHEPVHAMEANWSTTRTGTGPQDGPDSLTDSLAHSLLGAGTSAEGTERREDRQREEEPTPPSAEVPTVPGIPADLAQRIMAKTTATADELARIIADAKRDGIRRPVDWLRSEAGVADFPVRLDDLRATPAVASGPPPVADYRAAVRSACAEHGTPGGADRCALCRKKKPIAPPPVAKVPQQRDDKPLPSVDQSIAAAKAELDALRASLDHKSRTGPTHVIRPRQVSNELPAEVQAAHDNLDFLGDGKFTLLAAAREKLGPEAHRNEVVLLADRLATTNSTLVGQQP
ncbi:helix-turn-helix domain-containing protein [Streptosporangium sp. NPDC051023]|uniref:helix-turn-helix domain-containing protein n=1 Tax=Streptosporangium sp. NPDC051023 TaxID=3155410 RepID=UPI003450F9AA